MRPALLAGACALAVAGCQRPAPAPRGGPASPDASGALASPVQIPRRPLGPSPRVAWQGREIAVTGLPAVAEDGRAVVIARRDSDGGRGNPNLALIEKDRDDRVVARLDVVTASEIDQLAPAELARRFDAAARWLEQRHAAEHLVAMAALDTTAPRDDAPAIAIGSGVALRWAPSELVIDRAPDRPPGPTPPPAPRQPGDRDHILARATPASWLAADHPMCAACSEVCHSDAVLGGGHIDLARRVAVVVIAYRGSDACGEPSPEAHVVAW